MAAVVRGSVREVVWRRRDKGQAWREQSKLVCTTRRGWQWQWGHGGEEERSDERETESNEWRSNGGDHGWGFGGSLESLGDFGREDFVLLILLALEVGFGVAGEF